MNRDSTQNLCAENWNWSRNCLESAKPRIGCTKKFVPYVRKDLTFFF